MGASTFDSSRPSLSAASSIENLKNKTLTKNLSQVVSKIQTNNTKKAGDSNTDLAMTNHVPSTASTTRNQNSVYKILNP